MAIIQHGFTALGVANKAIYRNSIDLATVLQANNGEQIADKDGLFSAYLEYVENGIKYRVEYKNFINNDVTASISVQVLHTSNINTEQEQVIGSNILKVPKLNAQEYVDFYNLELPVGVTLAQAVNIKMLNYLCNFMHGNSADNYVVYCFDAATLQAIQPILFTVEQTTFDAVGGNIEVNVTDSTGALEYSLDGVTFQDSNVFTLTAGSYTITVRDGESIVNSRTFAVTVDI